MLSKRKDCRLMKSTTVLHGGVCHGTSNPHKSGNTMKKKRKEVLTFSVDFVRPLIDKNYGTKGFCVCVLISIWQLNLRLTLIGSRSSQFA